MVGSALLGRRFVGMRLATHTACLMSAAAPRPKVTQEPSRGGLISIAPGEGAAHTATFIGPIHGLGDTNMGWADIAGYLHMTPALGHIKFVLPNAPISPVTLNGGMSMPSWYDITSLDERAGQECAGIEDSRAVVNALIEEELEAGIPLSRIVVGGFSQGGVRKSLVDPRRAPAPFCPRAACAHPPARVRACCIVPPQAMSLYAGLQYDGTLAGVCVMSGYLPKSDTFSVPAAAKKTPVAHFHGAVDPTVKLEWARKSVDLVKAAGVLEYSLTEYPGMGHSSSQEEIDDVQAWLEKVLPPLP